MEDFSTRLKGWDGMGISGEGKMTTPNLPFSTESNLMHTVAHFPKDSDSSQNAFGILGSELPHSLWAMTQDGLNRRRWRLVTDL